MRVFYTVCGPVRKPTQKYAKMPKKSEPKRQSGRKPQNLGKPKQSVGREKAMRQIFLVGFLACVPTGSAPPWDGGTRTVKQTFVQAPDVLTQVFEDSFDDRADASPAAMQQSPAMPNMMPSVLEPRFAYDAGRAIGADARVLPERDAGARLPGLFAPVESDGGARVPSVLPMVSADTSGLGPNWRQSQTSAWRVENGKLCGKGARNHGVWLQKKIPINARIEFDAIATSEKGDLKTELWGDGQSAATSVSYTNATSYLAILGGWENTFHVLARVNEHGKDRKEIKVDKDSDDPRQHPVSVGQVYRFKIERSDSKTVRMFVNNIEYVSWADTEPLAGIGHDHFGFNNWEVKTCFDNVRVTPL
jgi:hypothetical protein